MPEETAEPQPAAAMSTTGGSGFWYKLPTLTAAFNPVLVLVVGFFLNQGIEQNKREIEANSAKLQDLKTVAETNTIALHNKIDKVKVIGDFLNDLTGPDERRRSLAIEAIFIALPEEAERLVKVVEKFAAKTTNAGHTGDDAIVSAAKDALANTRDRLVADMFSAMRQTRLEALATLEKGWTNDPSIAERLVARAMADIKTREAAAWTKPADDKTYQQLASIYNTVEFLSLFRGQFDAAQKARIAAFLTAAIPNSDDTKRVVSEIKDRYR